MADKRVVKLGRVGASEQQGLYETHDVVAAVRFAVSGPSRKQVVGPFAPRVCAFCSRREPDVSFSNEAHAIAAGLGNREIISNEDCDECNAGGSEAEGELVNLLAAERMLIRARRRSGESAPKLFGNDGESYATYDVESGNLELYVKGADPSVLLDTDETTKQGKLKLVTPKTRPLLAIRSLLRSAWMISDESFRSRHPELLALVKAGVPAPSQYVKLEISGGRPRAGELRVHERKARAGDTPPFVVELVYGNAIIFFAAPRADGSYADLPPPQFEIWSEEAPEFNARLHLIPDGQARSTRPFTPSFYFETRKTDVGPRRPSKPQRPSWPATLSAVDADGSVSLSASISLIESTDKQTKFSLGGGQLAAKMTITSRIEVEAAAAASGAETISLRLDVTPQFDRAEVDDVEATARFFEKLAAGAELLIESEEGVRRGRVSIDGEEWSVVRQTADNLASINRALGLKLRLPVRLDDEYAGAARALSSALQLGRGVFPAATLRFQVNTAEPERLLAEFDRRVVTITEQGPFLLGGVPVDVGPWTLELIEPRVETQAGAGTVALSMTASEMALVVERWRRSEGNSDDNES